MNKVQTSSTHEDQKQQFTSIMNPNVQKNLNDLIKTHRDQNVRMS